MENDFLFAILLTVVDIYNEIKKDKGLVVDPIKLTKAQLVDILAEKGKDKSEISKLTKEQLIELLG